MLHLGLGSFHRAHQAVYMHQLQQLGDLSWTLAGGNIRADMDDTITALQKQQGAYTLETVTPQGVHRYTRVQSIQTVVPYTLGVPQLVASELEIVRKVAGVMATLVPDWKLVVRPYPVLRDWSHYEALKTIPNVVVDDGFRVNR